MVTEITPTLLANQGCPYSENIICYEKWANTSLIFVTAWVPADMLLISTRLSGNFVSSKGFEIGLDFTLEQTPYFLGFKNGTLSKPYFLDQ